MLVCTCLSVFPSTCLYLTICTPICLYIYLSVCSCLFDWVSVCLSPCLSINQLVSGSDCLFIITSHGLQVIFAVFACGTWGRRHSQTQSQKTTWWIQVQIITDSVLMFTCLRSSSKFANNPQQTHSTSQFYFMLYLLAVWKHEWSPTRKGWFDACSKTCFSVWTQSISCGKKFNTSVKSWHSKKLQYKYW